MSHCTTDYSIQQYVSRVQENWSAEAFLSRTKYGLVTVEKMRDICPFLLSQKYHYEWNVAMKVNSSPVWNLIRVIQTRVYLRNPKGTYVP